MKIVQIDGGLGNQMFQYFFGLSLRSLGNKVHYSNLNLLRDKQHNGFELTRIFDIKDSFDKFRVLSYLLGILGRLEIKSRDYVWLNRFILIVENLFIEKERDFSVYSDKYFATNRFFVYFKGYWQSERYFKINPQEVFRFSKNGLNQNSLELTLILRDLKNSVSIHVRRGDYHNAQNLQGLGGAVGIDYYRSAVTLLTNEIDRPCFFVFSDDVGWAERNLGIEGAVYVSWNKGSESWQDMYLMSQCAHNIIANSSFSWWGAYLNSNLNKIVVAPKTWHLLHSAADICPPNWKRL
jgi:hypothetical protein